MSESEIITALRKRYAAPEYAFFGGMRNGTGGHFSRTADGIAMSLWPSRGLELIGFEVKISRADWARELRNPQKAESWVRRCHRWYIVVPDRALVQVGELPPTWGLMEVKGTRVAIVTQAPVLEPVPLDYKFLAAVLRHANETCASEAELRAAHEAGRKEAKAEAIQAEDRKAKRLADGLEAELADLRRDIAAFEAASGVEFRRWQGGQIGAAVKLGMQTGPQVENRRELLVSLRNAARRAHEFMEALEIPESIR